MSTSRQMACWRCCCVALIAGCWLAHAVTVQLTQFDSVSTNTPAQVQVTLSPTQSEEAVQFEIRCVSGSGSAVFWPTDASTSIVTASAAPAFLGSATAVISVQGSIPSSTSSNMVLEARVGGVSLASNVFTVVTDPMISASQAIGIAHAAITNTVDLQAGAPITAVLSAKTYVVTFWLELPPDTLGPDYSAKVTIDAFTGAVLFILGRS